MSASWIEGLLSGSGALLVHDDRLRALLDAWLREVPETHFVQALPLLRRTFAEFPAAERRVLGERLKSGSGSGTAAAIHIVDAEFDEAAARAVLPLLTLIWSKEAPQ